jgi:hypothetical protein
MRIPTYLSPSSLALWESDPEGFYLKHLAEVRAPKIPQTDYMAVGSAFDAYVKSELHAALFGKGADSRFEFDAIFSEQVEKHNHDFGIAAGEYIFKCYKQVGAYDELLRELEQSEFTPQFEFRLDGQINGVPLMGKPDCRYIHKEGAHVILDWKVNGFCSKYGSTPYKYYAMIRDGWKIDDAKPSRSNGKSHKGFKSIIHKSIEIGSCYLEETCKDWADQLSIYAWMLGEKVGDENVIVCIDQIACKYRELQFPLLRIANHRSRISANWQNGLVERLTKCWDTIQSGYIFTDMSREDSDSRCEVLEMEAASLVSLGNEDGVEAWVSQISRGEARYRKR